MSRRIGHFFFRLVSVASVFLSCSLASAGDAFVVAPARDLSISGGALGLGIGLWLLRDHSPPKAICKQDVCGVTGDGAYAYDSSWDFWSYLPVSVAMTGAMAPSIARAVDGEDRLGGAGDSSIALIQALSATMAATELAKTFAPRYRPFLAYPEPMRGRANRLSPDAAASFWSGHSAIAFAAATTGAIDACRGGGPLGCLGPSLLLHSLAVSTAAMRVLAGKHHASDVIVGGAVGSAIATIVALSHAPKGREEGADAMRVGMGAQAAMLSFSGVF